MTVRTDSQSETERLGALLAQNLDPPVIIFLKGDLGTGKTSFTRGFVRGTGSTDFVSSPTFAIANLYQSERGAINHLDLYRINSREEAFDIGLEDYLNDFTIIEWPELLGGEIEPDLIVEITEPDENRREFRFTGSASILVRRILEDSVD